MSTTSNSKTISIPGLCKAKSGTVCRCGRCAHLVHIASLRRGISMEAIWAALGATTPVSAPSKRALPTHARTMGSVAARASVISANGVRTTGPLAVLAVIDSMGGLT